MTEENCSQIDPCNQENKKRDGEMGRWGDGEISPSPLPWQPKVVAFLCNWCSYAGADLAGISRIQYPPNIRIIRVPCSGRINPVFILKALQTGADAVLVSGCHPGDCHYVSGNYYARRKFEVFDRLLDYVGLEPGRVFFSWVSAAEGEGFGRLIKYVVDEVEKLGPANKLVKTI